MSTPLLLRTRNRMAARSGRASQEHAVRADAVNGVRTAFEVPAFTKELERPAHRALLDPHLARDEREHEGAVAVRLEPDEAAREDLKWRAVQHRILERIAQAVRNHDSLLTTGSPIHRRRAAGAAGDGPGLLAAPVAAARALQGSREELMSRGGPAGRDRGPS